MYLGVVKQKHGFINVLCHGFFFSLLWNVSTGINRSSPFVVLSFSAWLVDRYTSNNVSPFWYLHLPLQTASSATRNLRWWCRSIAKWPTPGSSTSARPPSRQSCGSTARKTCISTHGRRHRPHLPSVCSWGRPRATVDNDHRGGRGGGPKQKAWSHILYRGLNSGW